MTSYIIRRLIQALIIVVLVSLLIFVAVRLLPGDPILIYLSNQDMQTLTIDQLQAVRAEFGLDKSLPEQYINWVIDLFHGKLGTSLFYHQGVGALLVERIPPTIILGIAAFFLSHILGICAGMISALRRGRPADTAVTVAANIGVTVPVFWLGIILIYFFGLVLGWLPRFGYISPFIDLGDSIKHAILPVICLSIFPLAVITRQTRSSVLEIMRQDYIRTAWSKGLKERSIVFKHILKNSLIPVLTLAGVNLGVILGGQVLVETVFNIPGMGRLGVEAIQSQDYAVIQGIVLLISCVVVTINLGVDLAYGWIDPRIRYS
jgi:peptide/nickel transport system permease protein